LSNRLPQLKSQLAATDSPILRRALLQQIAVENLRIEIRACRNCPLGRIRKHACPMTGPTHGRAQMVIVGEAPGAVEDREGEPFIGKSGMKLNECLEKAGTHRRNVAIMNTLACRPPDNRNPEPSELAACRPLFDKQLRMARTWVGVALGGYALANVLGLPRDSIRVHDYLEKPVWKDGMIWFGTYHPSYALRNPHAEVEIVLSLKAALALRLGDAQFPPMSWGSNQKTRDAEELVVLSELDILGKNAVVMGKFMQKNGWCYGHSEVLGGQILVVLDADKPRKKIPLTLLRLPTYTLAELVRIGEAGAARGGWNKTDMRRLHMVKVEFGGEVIA